MKMKRKPGEKVIQECFVGKGKGGNQIQEAANWAA